MWKIIFSLGYCGDYNILRKRRLSQLGAFYAPLYKLFQLRHGSYLPLECLIKGNIIFPHLQGIFISCGSVIGKECTIFQHVTIGSNYTKDSKNIGAPSIGDNCIIGVGAKIIGKVCIGNNCKIGAGVVISQDIPDNSTVVVDKPRILLNQ